MRNRDRGRESRLEEERVQRILRLMKRVCDVPLGATLKRLLGGVLGVTERGLEVVRRGAKALGDGHNGRSLQKWETTG